MDENIKAGPAANHDNADMSAKTFGQSLLGTSFDGQSGDKVNDIKRKAAELIDLINEIPSDGRRKALAFTNIETGVMFAVKALIV